METSAHRRRCTKDFVADVMRRLTALKHLKLEKQVLARTELSQIQPLLLYEYLSAITIFKIHSEQQNILVWQF